MLRFAKQVTLLFFLFAFTALTLTGCGGGGKSSKQPTPVVLPGAGVQFNHAVVVILENQNYASVVGSQAMPYWNSLAQKYALVTNYYSNSHESVAAHMMLASGKGFYDKTTVFSDDNSVRQLVKAGKTWKFYGEGLPTTGYMGDTAGDYDKDHNPFAYISDVVNAQAQQQNMVPFSQFTVDMTSNALPTYSYVVPTNRNNGSKCPVPYSGCTNDEKLKAADDWLKANIDPLIQNASFQQDGVLIITFDSAGDTSTDTPEYLGGKVATLIISPKVIAGPQTSTTTFDHAATLRVMLESVGMKEGQFPNKALSAPTMLEFFKK
jgi:phosphatidylinositol-3-phosphatase